MKAQELVNAVQDAEKELIAKIGADVNRVLNDLSIKTGLVLDGIDISLAENTSFETTERNYAITSISIAHRLPDKIFRG